MTSVDLFCALGGVLPPILDSELGGRRDLCILGTHVTVEVARYFGIECGPVVTLVRAANDAFFEWYHANGHPPSLEQMRGTPMYSVGCDGNQLSVRGWPFHLIAVADRVAFDPTAGQLHRPLANINVPRTLCFEWNPEAKQNSVALEAGALIYYQAVAGNTDYKRTVDWKRPVRPKLLGSVIRAVKRA